MNNTRLKGEKKSHTQPPNKMEFPVLSAKAAPKWGEARGQPAGIVLPSFRVRGLGLNRWHPAQGSVCGVGTDSGSQMHVVLL